MSIQLSKMEVYIPGKFFLINRDGEKIDEMKKELV